LKALPLDIFTGPPRIEFADYDTYKKEVYRN
jgi:hypothetical protein